MSGFSGLPPHQQSHPADESNSDHSSKKLNVDTMSEVEEEMDLSISSPRSELERRTAQSFGSGTHSSSRRERRGQELCV